MENKRVLLAIILSALVVFVYSTYFMPTPPQVSQQPTTTTETELSKEAIKTQETVADRPSKQAASQEVTLIKAEESSIDLSKFKAVFSSQGGGGLKSFELKEYRAELDEKSPYVNRVNIGAGDPLPLSLSFIGKDINLSNNDVFSIKEKGSNKLVYEWSNGEGVTFEKSYTFQPDDYKIDIHIRVINASGKTLEGSLGLSLFERYEDKERSKYDIWRVITRTETDLDTVDFDDLKKEKDIKEGNIRWIGLEDKYFITAILPEETMAGTVRSRSEKNSLIATTLEMNLSVDSGSEKLIKYSVYSGPKELNILKSVGKGLEEAIDLGFFHAIAEPLLRFLKFIYSYVGNYGYAIIVVTLIIKLLFFPLANKSYKSMSEMKKLQPQMTELKEKYKDNKERMSKEVMALYKKNRVNPLSGCLPMVLQIPVFIALYNVLLNGIELRHTPFHFWIVDLSTKDPYYITPIVMGATMFLQQKMSPSVPDATQQKVMMLMPVVFTFMFMNLPSGLVLYWVVNNILSITQQYYIMKRTT
ncbi:MAG: membrane protein insertase YidC [Proteobacteria bacterium]|nr:membrane protein insertase YidC [Pseudomonadota bacterium]